MSERRSPTAGTFARLAVASAIACAVLPEVVDLAAPMWRAVTVERAPPRAAPEATVVGPRVMGAYHTADDAAPGVDRFRFAAGSPFEDGSPEPGAVPVLNGDSTRGSPAGADESAAGAIPDRMMPAATEAAPTERDPIEPSKASEKIEPQAPQEEPQTAKPAAAIAPAAGVPALRTSVSPPDVVESAPAAPPPPAETAVLPAAPTAVTPPLPKPAPTVPSQPRAAEPQQAIKRPAATAGKANRPRRRSASAEDEAAAAKPVWRPSNLTNWPD